MAFKIRPFSLFKLQSVCLRALGIWPGPENQTLRRKHLALSIWHCVFTTIILALQLNFTFNSFDNMSAMIESLVLSLTGILVVIKMLVYLWKRDEFKELLETFDNLVNDGELAVPSSTLMESFSSTDRRSSYRFINRSMQSTEITYIGGFLSLAVITALFYITVPIIKYLISGENLWQLPFMMK
jgi:hypothetical protein